MSPAELERVLAAMLPVAGGIRAGYGPALAAGAVLRACGLLTYQSKTPAPSEAGVFGFPWQVESRGFGWVSGFVSWPNAQADELEIRGYLDDLLLNRDCGGCGTTQGMHWARHLPAADDSARNRVYLCNGCQFDLGWRRRQAPRIAFVGEVSPDGRLPLLGPSGDNLRRLMGIGTADFYRGHLALNLLPSTLAVRVSGVPERTFLRLHAMGLDPILSALPPDVPLVALGRRALHGLADGPAVGELYSFEVFSRLGRPVYALPHPSGRCRDWNLPDTRDRATALLTHLSSTNTL